MVGRYRHRGHGFLKRLVQHPGARNLLCHGVELIARERERVDLTVFQKIEDFVVGLIARDLGVLQMCLRAAHGGGAADRHDLDAGLVERRKIRDRRACLHDVGCIRHLVDRAEQHFRLALGILWQECDVPGACRCAIGDLPGVPVSDVFDGNAELRRHLLAEIDRHARIIPVFVLVGPVRATGGADSNPHPQFSGRRDFVLQPVGACRDR